MSVWYKKNRKSWMYKFRHNKKTYEAIGFKTKSAAAKAEREKLQELENIDNSTTRTVSFLELMTLYLDHCAATFRPNTIRYKRQYFKAFLKAARDEVPDKDTEPVKSKGRATPEISRLPKEMQVPVDVSAGAIPAPVFERFLDTVSMEHGRKLSNRFLRDLKALYNWGLKTGYVKENPLRYIAPKGEDVYRKYVPPQEDVNAVLLAANQEEMDLILILTGTGGRISEICRLTWEDVNFKKNAVTLWTRKRKGGGMQPDSMNMTKKVQKIMNRRWKNRNKQSQYVFCKPDGTRFTKDSHFIKEMMPRLCKRAKVKPFGYHAIRHRVASILMDSGKATLSNIQHFLRHNRPTTTENYLKSLNPGSQEMADILDSYDMDMERDGEENKSNNQQ